MESFMWPKQRGGRFQCGARALHSLAPREKAAEDLSFSEVPLYTLASKRYPSPTISVTAHAQFAEGLHFSAFHYDGN